MTEQSRAPEGHVQPPTPRDAPPDDDSREEGERLLRQGSASVIATAVGKISMFALHVLLARRLGATGYGAFVVAYTIAGLLLKGATFGVPKVVMRGIARTTDAPSRGRWREIAATGFTSVAIMSLVLAIAVVGFSMPLAALFFSEPGGRSLILIGAATLPLFGLFDVTQAVLHATRRIVSKQVLRDIGRPLIFLVLAWAAVEWRARPAAALVAYGLTGVILVCAGGLMAWRALASEPGGVESYGQSEERMNVGSMLSASYPFLLAGLMYQAATYSDRLMLGALASEASVGLYGAAAVVAQQVSGLSITAVAFVVTPVLAKLAVDDSHRERLKSLYVSSTKWMIVVGALIATMVFVLREPILALFGQDFGAASGVLTLLLVGHLVFVAVGPSGELLQMGGWEKLDLKNTAGMVLCNVLLNALLIPPFGAMGAAIATATSFAAINVAQAVELRHLYELRPLRNLDVGTKCGVVAVLATGALAGWSAHGIRPVWTALAALAVAAWTIHAMILTPDERLTIHGIIRRLLSDV
jgi:O-antigen/teichoic acid export membrane protein